MILKVGKNLQKPLLSSIKNYQKYLSLKKSGLFHGECFLYVFECFANFCKFNNNVCYIKIKKINIVAHFTL